MYVNIMMPTVGEEDVGPWRGEMQDSEKGADSVDGRCT